MTRGLDAHDQSEAIRRAQQIMIDLSNVRKHPAKCDHETTRDGYLVPCEKPAVAICIDKREPPAKAYPVCAYHANRHTAALVPLPDIFEWAETHRDPALESRLAFLMNELSPENALDELLLELRESIDDTAIRDEINQRLSIYEEEPN